MQNQRDILPTLFRQTYRDALSVVRDLVAHVLDLVAADDVLEAVPLQEPVGDVGAEMSKSKQIAEGQQIADLLVTSGPNWQPTPRLLGDRPGIGCGSDHSSSHMIPSSGGCRFRSVFRMSSSVISSCGENDAS